MDEKKEDNVKTSIVKDIKEEDKKNPFFEDERIEYNTKTSIIEKANEQDDNNPVFKDEKVEDSTKISVNEDLNEEENKNPFFEDEIHLNTTVDKMVVHSVPDFNSNVLQMLVTDHEKQTNPFWTEDKDENDNHPPKKTETDFRHWERGKEESYSSSLQKEPDDTVLKKSLCQSISLDITKDEKDKKLVSSTCPQSRWGA